MTVPGVAATCSDYRAHQDPRPHTGYNSSLKSRIQGRPCSTPAGQVGPDVQEIFWTGWRFPKQIWAYSDFLRHFCLFVDRFSRCYWRLQLLKRAILHLWVGRRTRVPKDLWCLSTVFERTNLYILECFEFFVPFRRIQSCTLTIAPTLRLDYTRRERVAPSSYCLLNRRLNANFSVKSEFDSKQQTGRQQTDELEF